MRKVRLERWNNAPRNVHPWLLSMDSWLHSCSHMGPSIRKHRRRQRQTWAGGRTQPGVHVKLRVKPSSIRSMPQNQELLSIRQIRWESAKMDHDERKDKRMARDKKGLMEGEGRRKEEGRRERKRGKEKGKEGWRKESGKEGEWGRKGGTGQVLILKDFKW